MRRGALLSLILMSLVLTTPAWAERAGGTLHYVSPYGGDLLGLDAHKSTRIQDFLVMTSINRSLYSWEPGVNKPKLELATKAYVSADGVLLEDAALMFFNYNKAVMAYHPWVHGLKPSAVDMVYQDYVNIWMEESSPRANEK